MFPIIIDFGTHNLPLVGEVHLHLPTYGVLFAVSAVVAWWWFMARGRTLGVSEEHLFNLCFYVLLAGILGAKLFLIALNAQYYLGDLPDLGATLGKLLSTLRSAGVLIGGIIAASLTFIVYTRRHKLNTFRLADAIAAPLALAQGIGRLGCFCAGCCHGVPVGADNPIGVTFTDPDAIPYSQVPLNIPLVPTQLLQLANDVLLALLLTWMWRRRSGGADGNIFWWYMVLYGVGRSIIEIWRGDAERGLFFGDFVSTSQVLGLAGAAIGVFMLVRSRRRPAGEATG